MPTDIPLARDLLKAALRMNSAEAKDHFIREALPIMKRRVRKRPAPPEARKVTSAIVAAVLVDLEQNPDDSTRLIGERHGINAGRVSEIANGLRTVANPSMKGDGLSAEIREAMTKEEPDG